MAAITQTQLRTEFDPQSNTLHLEELSPLSSWFGDFTRDFVFRQFILEYLGDNRKQSEKIHQITIDTGRFRYIYGKPTTTKITIHAKNIQKIVDVASNAGYQPPPVEEILSQIHKGGLFTNVFDIYMQVLYLRKSLSNPMIEKIYDLLVADTLIQEFFFYYKETTKRSLDEYYELVISFERYGVPHKAISTENQ